MTANNMTIEELKAVVMEELQELNGHLRIVNDFFNFMGQENAWVTNSAAYCQNAARVVDLLRKHAEAVFKLVGNESSSSSEGRSCVLGERTFVRTWRNTICSPT